MNQAEQKTITNMQQNEASLRDRVGKLEEQLNHLAFLTELISKAGDTKDFEALEKKVGDNKQEIKEISDIQYRMAKPKEDPKPSLLDRILRR